MNIQEELKTTGTFPSFYGPGMGTPKYNTPITPLDNIRLACKRDADGNLKGEQIWAPQGGDALMICPKIIPDNISRGFVVEANSIDNSTQAGGPDMFGVEWEWVPTAGGSMVRPGTKQLLDDPDDLLEWEKFVKFPDIDAWDWEGNAAQNKELLYGKERAVMPWIMTGFFERLISFMEFQNAAVAMIDEEAQEAVHRLFDKLCDLYDKMIGYYAKYYDATMIYFHDDWGSQQKSFMSYETYDEMVVPYLRRVADSCHKRGMYLVLHSCGKIENLVPLMVKAQVDVWSGQPMNDRLRVVQENKGKIYVEFGPSVGGFGMPPASEEEQLKGINEWLDTYGDYLDTIFVNTSFGGNPLLYKAIYEYSRKKFNR